MADREEWGTRAGFIIAAVGSAIGLGNIWRFPYVAYANGGGAFFLPYLVALLTAGLPVLVLEYTLGHRFRGSAPLSFRRLDRRAEWIGWWQVAVSFIISTYYAVVVAWALAYTWFAFGTRWGGDTGGFFLGDFLQATEGPGEFGSLVPNVLIPLALVWVVTLAVLWRGVRKGIETTTKVMIPLLVVIFLALVVRAITLPGSLQGLDAFFRPDFSGLLDSRVWVAAYGQIFFSLSVAFAIMITYASYLPRRSDLTNSGFIAGFANSSFELLAGIGVFGALGFLAASQGVGVDEVAEEGVGLAFVVFPQIINTFPGANSLFGVLFFASLVLAGLSSLISVVQTYVAALQEKFKLSRRAAVAAGGGTAAVLSLIFATDGGLYVLDAVDYFINNFGIALVGLTEVVLIAWVLRSLPRFQRHANEVSDLRLGRWWLGALGLITPLLLGYQLFETFRTTVTQGYEGYPTAFLVAAGWSVAALAVLAGIVLALRPWDERTLDLGAHTEQADAPARQEVGT